MNCNPTPGGGCFFVILVVHLNFEFRPRFCSYESQNRAPFLILAVCFGATFTRVSAREHFRYWRFGFVLGCFALNLKRSVFCVFGPFWGGGEKGFCSSTLLCSWGPGVWGLLAFWCVRPKPQFL